MGDIYDVMKKTRYDIVISGKIAIISLRFQCDWLL